MDLCRRTKQEAGRDASFYSTCAKRRQCKWLKPGRGMLQELVSCAGELFCRWMDGLYVWLLGAACWLLHELLSGRDAVLALRQAQQLR